MERKRTVFLILVSLARGVVIIFGLKNDSSETFMSVENNKKAILPCSVFEEVVRLDGAYDFVRWYMWTSNGLVAQWTWFIAMEQDGAPNPLKGFNISKENGSLYIDEAKPCDARRFMCVVDRINGTSPKRHFVTLQLRNESGNRTTNSTKTEEQEPQDCKCNKGNRTKNSTKTEEQEPQDCKPNKAHSNGNTYATALVIVVFIAIVQGGYILYLKWRYLRALYQRCFHRANTDAPGDVGQDDL